MLDQNGLGLGEGKRRPRGVDFPVRFFGVMHFDRPTDLPTIWKWCGIFYRSSGLFRDVVDKLSRYCVTTVETTGNNAAKWNDILNHQLKRRKELINIALVEINNLLEGYCNGSIKRISSL